MIAAEGQILGVAAPTSLLILNFHDLKITLPASTHSMLPKDIHDAE
jgi:hypothetical protein